MAAPGGRLTSRTTNGVCAKHLNGIYCKTWHEFVIKRSSIRLACVEVYISIFMKITAYPFDKTMLNDYTSFV